MSTTPILLAIALISVVLVDIFVYLSLKVRIRSLESIVNSFIIKSPPTFTYNSTSSKDPCFYCIDNSKCPQRSEYFPVCFQGPGVPAVQSMANSNKN